MEALNTTRFHLMLLRKKNIWYSVKDGNWSDPNTWMSNVLDRRSITFPQPTDDVVINHNVTYDNTLSGTFLYNNIVSNLTVNGTLSWAAALNQSILSITGNLRCLGTVDLSGSTGGGGAKILIGGINNFIANFVPGGSSSNSTVYYTSPYNHLIPSANYYNLQIGGNSANKFISADLTINGLLAIDPGTTFELGSYNVSVKDIVINGTLSKNSSTGSFTVTNAASSNFNPGSVTFSGNPTINWSGNMSGDLRNGVNFGLGTFNILTNSTWTLGNAGNQPGSIGSNNFVIASGKTLTLNGGAAWLNNGSVMGADSTSILNVVTHYGYGNNNVAMPTGTFNYNYSGTSTIWVANSATVTMAQTAFYNLTVLSGTAMLSGNTTVSGSLTVSGTLQMAAYNFNVTGVTSHAGVLLKSGAGTVTFGLLTPQSSTGSIDFSAGNPTVNLTGNVIGDYRSGLNFGSTPVNITQSITYSVWGGGNVPFFTATNYLIASGKTLTVSNGGGNGGLETSGTITGADNTAILDNRGNLIYNCATAPMVTGKLYCNQAINSFTYGASGNQDIQVPADATPGYKNLILQGSGVKKLLGNVSVKSVYTLNSPATLNSNGFALTNP